MSVLPQFRDPNLETSGNPVGFYPREFYPLDNFSSFQVDWRDRRWPTVEHAFQAAHFIDTSPELVEAIFAARSAHEAFKIARANHAKVPADWWEKRVGVMEEIVRAKLVQNPYVQQKLLETGDIDLVEDSPKDDFWGWGSNRDGSNELGKIWMRLRDWWKLKATEILSEYVKEKVIFKTAQQVKEGVECETYDFEDDDTKDLAVVHVAKGSKTPRQKIVKGSRTIESYASGRGVLTVVLENGQVNVYDFANGDKTQEIEVRVGQIMQWQAGVDSELTFYEVCYPPYQDGRFENLPD